MTCDILARCAFRWLLNGEVICNGYSMFPVEHILKMINREVDFKIDEDNYFLKGLQEKSSGEV